MQYSKTLSEAIEKLAGQSGVAPSVIWNTTNGSEHQLKVFETSKSDPREELIITYTVGTLKFAKDGGGTLYGLLDMQQFDLDGKPNGIHLTVWQPLQPPSELVKVPFPDFIGPYDRPSPIAHAHMRANSKAVWRFRDGSEIRATGPANSMIVPFNDTSALFCVSVAAILTGGTMQYEGCRGVKTALGSSFVPRGTTFDDITDGRSIGGVTVEAFRVVKKYDM